MAAKAHEDAARTVTRAEALYDRYRKDIANEEAAPLLTQAEAVTGRLPADVLGECEHLKKAIPWRQWAKDEMAARLVLGKLVSGAKTDEVLSAFKAVSSEVHIKPRWAWWHLV